MKKNLITIQSLLVVDKKGVVMECAKLNLFSPKKFNANSSLYKLTDIYALIRK